MDIVAPPLVRYIGYRNSTCTARLANRGPTDCADISVSAARHRRAAGTVGLTGKPPRVTPRQRGWPPAASAQPANRECRGFAPLSHVLHPVCTEFLMMKFTIHESICRMRRRQLHLLPSTALPPRVDPAAVAEEESTKRKFHLAVHCTRVSLPRDAQTHSLLPPARQPPHQSPPQESMTHTASLTEIDALDGAWNGRTILFWPAASLVQQRHRSTTLTATPLRY